jgi:hypothetical protein
VDRPDRDTQSWESIMERWRRRAVAAEQELDRHRIVVEAGYRAVLPSDGSRTDDTGFCDGGVL